MKSRMDKIKDIEELINYTKFHEKSIQSTQMYFDD